MDADIFVAISFMC